MFAPPTYIYIASLILLIVVGLYRIFVQDLGPIDVDALVANGDLSPEALELSEGTAALSLLMLLRAFSSGAVALSGVEAVSNGVPAFRKPESRNAAMTIAIMGVILGHDVPRRLDPRLAPQAVPRRARPDRHRA